MATDSANALTWYLALDRMYADSLGALRTWSHLQAGFDGKKLWVKGFTEPELTSATVRIIPHKALFYEQQGRLFPRGSRLPAQTVPTVLWSPLRAALPVELPPRQSGLAALTKPIPIQLVSTVTEQPAVALYVSLSVLAAYAQTAPAVRLRGLRWLIMGQTHALVLGSSSSDTAVPLLPLPGDAFWQKGDWLLPAGLDMAFPVLDTLLNQKLNPDGDDWLLWQPTGTYLRLPKSIFAPLSISSVRQSLTS